jgi:hypothetical protein
MHLRDWKARHGLTDRAIAELIGVTRSAVCRYMGGRNPRPEVWPRIVAATDGWVTPNDHLAGPDTKPPLQIAAPGEAA